MSFIFGTTGEFWEWINLVWDRTSIAWRERKEVAWKLKFWSRDLPQFLSLFIDILPFNHLGNVFFSPICACIWRVRHWVLLHPKVECKEKNWGASSFGFRIVGQENSLRFEPNWWKVWKAKKQGNLNVDKVSTPNKKANHSQPQQDNKEGTSQRRTVWMNSKVAWSFLEKQAILLLFWG